MLIRLPFICASLLLIAIKVGAAAPPRVADNRLIIELSADKPDIVTPTGLTVDEQGRVWVIENHTHQRPANYKGPATDRIRVFSEAGPDGKFRKVTTFADGFKNGMGLALNEHGVYVATRSDIWLLSDPNNTGKAEKREVVVKLESTGDYPHNGLSGFAFHRGLMYFSLGENLGAPYKLVGSDGKTLSGGGEGGSIYRCRMDGKELERVATGFWNTFHLTFDSFGRLFAIDNDPDSRGPCRLLHIVKGGDYGYRFRNGRRGLHPFTSWNGELPGTLPMVAGTAEAPSGILAYDSIGLPAEYRDRLLVTSWGDHVVEQFTLSPRGASFSATSSVMVRGGEDFRPVGIACAPDGSIYLSDWVDKSYPVHGQGRIWHIRMKEPPKDDGLRRSKLEKLGVERLTKLLTDPRRDIREAAAMYLVDGHDGDALVQISRKSPEIRARLAAVAAYRPTADTALKDEALEVRGAAIDLIGDEKKVLALAINDPSAYVRMQAILHLRNEHSRMAVFKNLGSADPFLVAAALEFLGRPGGSSELLSLAVGSDDARLRLGVLLALRRAGEATGRKHLPKFLADPDPAVRRAAIQWVGEERLKEFQESIADSAAKEPVTRDLFEALLAATAMLADGGKSSPETSGEEHLARVVKDVKQPAVFRTFALRMLRPDHPVLTTDLLAEMLKGPQPLRSEVVRTMAMRADAGTQRMLRALASDDSAAAGARAFAVLGLAHSADASLDTRRVLLALLADAKWRRDALRSLRGVALSKDERDSLCAWWDGLPVEKGAPSDERRELAEQMSLVLGPKADDDSRKRLAGLLPSTPGDQAAWLKALAGKGDAEAGERVFYHWRGARCAVCHRIDGRGGEVGPELSAIAASHNRDKLLESILAPSKEIAPAFTTWTMTMADGKSHSGVIVAEGFDSTLTLADAEGKRIVLKKLDIEKRQASTKSLMPDDLHRQMTRREFRDLLEYLGTRRPQSVSGN
jgi:putative membrane-bound dehydrogenase-like protein